MKPASSSKFAAQPEHGKHCPKAQEAKTTADRVRASLLLTL